MHIRSGDLIDDNDNDNLILLSFNDNESFVREKDNRSGIDVDLMLPLTEIQSIPSSHLKRWYVHLYFVFLMIMNHSLMMIIPKLVMVTENFFDLHNSQLKIAVVPSLILFWLLLPFLIILQLRLYLITFFIGNSMFSSSNLWYLSSSDRRADTDTVDLCCRRCRCRICCHHCRCRLCYLWISIISLCRVRRRTRRRFLTFSIWSCYHWLVSLLLPSFIIVVSIVLLLFLFLWQEYLDWLVQIWESILFCIGFTAIYYIGNFEITYGN